MIMKFFYFSIHRFHALFCRLDLLFGMFNVLLVFLRMLFAVTEIKLTFGGKESPKNIWAVANSSAAILNRGNVADILMRVGGSVLFERQDGVELLVV